MKTTARTLVLACALSAAAAASPSFAVAAPTGAEPAGDLSVPPEMIAKLSPEQIVSILREREMRRATFSGRPADVVGTTIFFGALVTIVLVSQLFATRRERVRQETLRAMVEKGVEIPPALIGDRARRSCDLRRGLVLVGAGLGVSIAFALVQLNGQSGSGLWSIGLVPMLMGGGYLVAWRVETGNGSDGSDRP